MSMEDEQDEGDDSHHDPDSTKPEGEQPQQEEVDQQQPELEPQPEVEGETPPTTAEMEALQERVRDALAEGDEAVFRTGEEMSKAIMERGRQR